MCIYNYSYFKTEESIKIIFLLNSIVNFFININYYNFGKHLFFNHSKTITHIYYKQYYKIYTFLL